MDEDIKKQRTSLIAISFVIIVYILGKGTINSGSFLGGSITFKNESTLEISAALIYVYLLYRYILYGIKDLKNIVLNIKYVFYTDEAYVIYALNWLSKLKEQGINVYTEKTDYTIWYTMGGIVKQCHPQIVNLLLPEKMFLPNEGIIKPSNPEEQSEAWESIKSYQKIKDDSLFIKTNILFMYRILIRSIVKALLTNKTFTDIVFPYLIASLAGALIIYRYTS